MLKTFRRIYEKGKSFNDDDTSVDSRRASEESMQMSARRLAIEREGRFKIEEREVQKPKKTYKQRVESMPKKIELDDLDGIDTDYISQFIKNFCFICGGKINDHTKESRLRRYIRRGNSCDDCNTRIDERIKNR